MPRGQVQDRIIRVLLVNPQGTLTRYRITQLTDCSWKWVSQLLRKLEARRLTQGTTVIDYSGLIRYWLETRPTRNLREYMLQDPLNLLQRSKLSYALTTYQAENMIQHYLFPSRTDAYVLTKDLEKWHKQVLDAGGLVGRGNLRLLLADGYALYGALNVSDYKIVCRPQLIADLMAEGGPAKEAGELLLRKVNSHPLSAL
jgi:hypothetical protein